MDMQHALPLDWTRPTEQLYEALDEEIKRILLEESRVLPQSQRCIILIHQAITELKEYVIQGQAFRNSEEEIVFFKEIKPKFFHQLIYFIQVMQIETRRPTGSREAQRSYLQEELNRLQRFFEDNRSFYQYYRSGSTHLDEKYFVRGACDILLELDSFSFDADPAFSTSHDHKLAQLLAHEGLSIYLNQALAALEQPEYYPTPTSETPRARLSWTFSKTALIELLYALQSVGAFNHSAADVKQMATYLEKVFNVDLGNYYRTFQEIRLRKSGRTNFLDLMKEKLIQRMDEADENPR